MSFLFEFKWDGTNWIDEVDYVVAYDIEVGFPISEDNFLFDNIADVGTAKIVLNNESGRFLINNTGGTLYGDLDVGTRFRWRVSGPTIFEGEIIDIVQGAGADNEQLCIIYCVDDIQKLKDTPLNLSTIQTDLPVSDAMQDLVEMAFTPSLASYQDNGDEIPVFGRQWSPETSVYTALKDIARTYFGWLFIGHANQLFYKTRQYFQENHASGTLWNDGAVGAAVATHHINILLSGKHIRNQLNLIYHPEQELGSTVVLWEAVSWIGLAAGRTRTYFLRYRDPNTGDLVASTDVEAFTATTDYVINSKHDGSGTNLTSDPNISISTVIEVHQMKVTVTNNKGINIFFTTMQCRGKPIIVFDPINLQYNDATSQSTYGLKSETINMITGVPQDYGVEEIKGANDLGDLWLGYLANPYLYCNKISVQGTFLALLFNNYLVIEEETGLDDWHKVMRIRWHGTDSIENSDFWLIPGRMFNALLLDDTDYGKLDDARLGT